MSQEACCITLHCPLPPPPCTGEESTALPNAYCEEAPQLTQTGEMDTYSPINIVGQTHSKTQ